VTLGVHRLEGAANDVSGMDWRVLMIVFGPFYIAHFLVVAGKCAMQKTTGLELIGSVVLTELTVLHLK
jgi:hypothetical protein